VRRVLLSSHDDITPQAELFLYLAARSQLVEDVIRPALERGDVVISDRFSLSTYAYQIGGRRLPAREVLVADRLARNGVTPDVTIVLTVTEQEARRRQRLAGQNPDRMEREQRSFFRRVGREYARRTHNQPRMVVIDSALGPDRVYEIAKSQLDRRLKRRGLK